VKRRLWRAYSRLHWHKIAIGTWPEFLQLTAMDRFLALDELDDLIERHNEAIETPPTDSD
jgi:hypothetical protein